MGTVWAVNPTDNDLNAVAEYGDIRYVNTRYVYGDEINADRLPTELTSKFWIAAKQFNWKEDYLLLIGDHLQLVLFASKLSQVCGEFRVLRWDRQAKGYLTCWIST